MKQAPAAQEYLSRLKPWQYLAAVALTACLIFLYFVTLAQTPRGSLNVIKIVTVLFLFIVFVRQRKRREAANHPSGGGAKKTTGIWVALAVGACAWSVCVPNYFISDDFVHLLHSRGPFLKSVWMMLVQGQTGTFLRPFGYACIFLDYRLWGVWAPGYHITNLALHLAGVAGLYLFCRELRFRSGAAGTAALIFAVMPIHAETVAWLGSRFDLLSTCLTVWTFVFYVKFRNTKRGLFFLCALACFSLAVFSKENAYVAPLLLLALECLMFRDRRLKRIFPFFLAAGIFFFYRWIILGGIGGYSSPDGNPTVFSFGIKTLEGFFVGVPAYTILGFNWSPPWVPAIRALASLTASSLLVIALAARPGSIGLKRIIFCIVWIVVSILPANPMIFFGAYLTNSRFLYLGSVGMALLVAQLISSIEAPRIRRVSGVFLVFLLFLGVVFNLTAWRYASRLTQKLMTEVVLLEPSPPPGTLYVFHSMPATVRGVFNLKVGLQEAIQQAYGRKDIRAIRSGDDDPNPASDSAQSPVIHWEWKEGREFLVQRLQQ